MADAEHEALCNRVKWTLVRQKDGGEFVTQNPLLAPELLIFRSPKADVPAAGHQNREGILIPGKLFRAGNTKQKNSMKKLLFAAAISAVALGSASISQAQQLFITQYYEGPSTNKYIEITNLSLSTINLSEYTLALFSNSGRENYKTNGAANGSFSLSGNLASGASILYGNTGNTTPSYAASIDITNNTVINFNGDDSIVLYRGTLTSANIVDAFGLSGNNAADTSVVRISNGVGWNLTSGSQFSNFASVWSNVGLTAADNALAGTNARLGFSTLTAVPEPHEYALGFGLMLVALVAIRRRKAMQA